MAAAVRRAKDKMHMGKFLNSDTPQLASSALVAASAHIIRQTRQQYLLSTAVEGRSDEGSLYKVSDVGGQREKVESVLTLGGRNEKRNKPRTVPKGVGLWRTLSGFLTDRLECVDNHASQMKAAARATKEAKRSASLS